MHSSDPRRLQEESSSLTSKSKEKPMVTPRAHTEDHHFFLLLTQSSMLASHSLWGFLGTHICQALGSLEASSVHTEWKGGELKASLIIMNFINTAIPLYLTDVGPSRPREEEQTFLTLKISASALRKALTNPNQLQIQHLTLLVKFGCESTILMSNSV